MACMSLVEGTETGKRTVPEQLIGCWKRHSIVLKDGTVDRTTRVLWLQTASGVADIRISADRPDMRHRSGLASCTRDELLALAEQDCFAATTLFDPAATPYPMAIWPISLDLFRFQPVVSYPEPGWLEWKDNGSVMMEYAPSGAYEEDWRLLETKPPFAIHLMKVTNDAIECLYVVGNHAVRARSRRQAITQQRPLPEIARGLGDDLEPIREMLDCEFSYAQRDAASKDYVIELSTLPWLEGQKLNCDWVFDIAAGRVFANDPDGHAWKVESLWRSESARLRVDRSGSSPSLATAHTV